MTWSPKKIQRIQMSIEILLNSFIIGENVLNEDMLPFNKQSNVSICELMAHGYMCWKCRRLHNDRHQTNREILINNTI